MLQQTIIIHSLIQSLIQSISQSSHELNAYSDYSQCVSMRQCVRPYARIRVHWLINASMRAHASLSTTKWWDYLSVHVEGKQYERCYTL